MKRFSLLYVAPTVLLLLAVALPLMRGSETLFLRDVMNAHLQMKGAQVHAWRQGTLPVIDPYRAGGQPSSGNPNSVPFYPDNLLYLLAPALWALNAHFWLHLFLAPFAFYGMARAWGLGREGAWAGAVAYGFSGFCLSHLAFYNLVAGAALAPALVAACLVTADGQRRWGAAATAVIWALIVLAGDPFLALLAGLLAASAVFARGGWPAPRRLGWLVLAVLVGTLVAAPQLVEFLRILPASFRGHWRYTGDAGTVASFDPRQSLEWLLPLAFGRPDLMQKGAFWGRAFYTGVPYYYFSLYPGLLVLGLVASSGMPRSRGARWAWGAVGAGLFFSLGRFNPLVTWFFEHTGVLRYPIKFWLAVALGGSLLAAVGFERVFEEGRRRSLLLALGGLAAVLGGAWLWLSFAPGASHSWLRGLIPDSFDDAFVANERLRWAGLCLLSLLLLGGALLLLRLGRKSPKVAGAALLTLHAASQLAFLAPLRATDEARPYTLPPPPLALVPEGARVAHGSFGELFGEVPLRTAFYPQPQTRWLARRTYAELYPFAGTLWGRHYELDVSPEDLDSFLTQMARGAVRQSEDPARVRLLRAWGVDHLLLHRPLPAEVLAQVELAGKVPSFGQGLWVYRLRDPLPVAHFVGEVRLAPHLNAAYSLLSDPGFDPAVAAVLPGDGPARHGAGGEVRVRSASDEEIEIEVWAGSAGVLVVQRAYLPLYRAQVDGVEAEITAANLHRLGIELGPGEHEVRVWVDRRPLYGGLGLGLLGLVAIAGLAWLPGRR